MMNSNGFLGNELQFGDDPFISGGLPDQENDQLFEGLYGDSFLVEQETTFENNNQFSRNDEFEGFHAGDPFHNMCMEGAPGIFGYDIFANFKFEHQDVESELEQISEQCKEKSLDHTLEQPLEQPVEQLLEQFVEQTVEQPLEAVSQQVETIVDTQAAQEKEKVVEDVAPRTETGSKLQTALDLFDMAEKQNSYVVPNEEIDMNSTDSQNAFSDSTTQTGFNDDQQSSAVPYYFDQSANQYGNYVVPSYQQQPYVEKPILSTRPKMLFPVKVKKVIPEYPKARSNNPAMRQRISPYAMQSARMKPAQQNVKLPPQQRCAPFVPVAENQPSCAPKTPPYYPDYDFLGEEFFEGEEEPSVAQTKPKTSRLKMTSIVPRDVPSNHIKCSMCLSLFATKLALEFHEVERHPHAFAYKCIICTDVFTTIAMANSHCILEHKKETAPLLDESIFGNGALSDHGRKSSQRRFSGMIWSFLSNHLAQTGKLTGTAEDKQVIEKEAKSFLHYSRMTEQATWPGRKKGNQKDFKSHKVQIEETASINDLLKQAYIYGPSIRRLTLSSIPPYTAVHSYDPNKWPRQFRNFHMFSAPDEIPKSSTIYPKRTFVVPTQKRVLPPAPPVNDLKSNIQKPTVSQYKKVPSGATPTKQFTDNMYMQNSQPRTNFPNGKLVMPKVFVPKVASLKKHQPHATPSSLNSSTNVSY